jgi:hypothetical protein
MAELANKSDHKCKRWLVNPIRIIQRHCIIQILQIAGEWFGAKSWGFVFLCLGTSSTGGGGRGGGLYSHEEYEHKSVQESSVSDRIYWIQIMIYCADPEQAVAKFGSNRDRNPDPDQNILWQKKDQDKKILWQRKDTDEEKTFEQKPSLKIRLFKQSNTWTIFWTCSFLWNYKKKAAQWWKMKFAYYHPS